MATQTPVVGRYWVDCVFDTRQRIGLKTVQVNINKWFVFRRFEWSWLFDSLTSPLSAAHVSRHSAVSSSLYVELATVLK